MDIRLEIAGDRRMAVFDLGPVEAPRLLNDFALRQGAAHKLIAAVQHAFAGLRAEACGQRRSTS